MPYEIPNLRNRIRAYFSACDKTAEEVTGKNGRARTARIPYTLAGLADAVGAPKDVLLEMSRQNGPNGRALAAALRRIERYTVERALLGELQSSAATMLLSDLGVGAKEAPPADGKRIVIVLEDEKGWSE